MRDKITDRRWWGTGGGQTCRRRRGMPGLLWRGMWVPCRTAHQVLPVVSASQVLGSRLACVDDIALTLPYTRHRRTDASCAAVRR